MTHMLAPFELCLALALPSTTHERLNGGLCRLWVSRTRNVDQSCLLKYPACRIVHATRCFLFSAPISPWSPLLCPTDA
ncbi:hypothetical protein FA95DRAFT_1555003 [Auriscalpium vulgare]|uniref:Uncharacterized protein n=1 Tax=Auriscalpium vulgare TaxID=40419 RepID=A0ACB8S3X2_9AGAM|nr:hypothetical protein FA95DRAFT_1555003 [Auriscalpium vulgare]